MAHHDHHPSPANLTEAVVQNASKIVQNVTEAIVKATVAPEKDDGFAGLFFPPADSDTLKAGISHASHDHSAHQHHNHGDHGAAAHGVNHNHGGHEMKMWFHGGYNEVVLFDFWTINSLYGLVLSCAFIFVMAAGYEALKWFRVYLSTMSSKRCEPSVPLLNGNCHHENSGEDVYNPTTTPPTLPVHNRKRSSILPPSKVTPFAGSRLVDAILYVIQLTVAYWLMLIAMTYNVYLTAAVVLGAGFGHWLFAALNCMSADSDHADAFTSDACH
ncbi:hypothetical protein L596_014449 [Steinernema carpocapsae]|uniref:Copper transport protein n=1 Tax=Steinernema carpocapsae TaxID=34508 RepID=A0A4V6XW74_STECR|nr:hypothetical protein L596_014449 [Steinernema carpocapsae]